MLSTENEKSVAGTILRILAAMSRAFFAAEGSRFDVFRGDVNVQSRTDD